MNSILWYSQNSYNIYFAPDYILHVNISNTMWWCISVEYRKWQQHFRVNIETQILIPIICASAILSPLPHNSQFMSLCLLGPVATEKQSKLKRFDWVCLFFVYISVAMDLRCFSQRSSMKIHTYTKFRRRADII